MEVLTDKQLQELELSNKRKQELGIKDEVNKYWSDDYKMSRLLYDVLNWQELKEEVVNESLLDFYI